jgi:hypothetical protein
LNLLRVGAVWLADFENDTKLFSMPPQARPDRPIDAFGLPEI